LATAVLLAGFGLQLVSAAAAQPRPAPTGYGKAHFAMSVATVRAAYPELQEAPKVAGYLSHPDLQRYVLWHTRITGLDQPVDIEIRFWKDRLWTVLFYCGGNSTADVQRYLTEQYGTAAASGSDPAWTWPDRTLVLQPKHGWFSIADKTISKEAQTVLAPAAGAPRPDQPPQPAAPNATPQH
jgi:hypothetical protein